MIIAAAEQAGCERIWSEHVNSGEKYFGIAGETHSAGRNSSCNDPRWMRTKLCPLSHLFRKPCARNFDSWGFASCSWQTPSPKALAPGNRPGTMNSRRAQRTASPLTAMAVSHTGPGLRCPIHHTFYLFVGCGVRSEWRRFRRRRVTRSHLSAFTGRQCEDHFRSTGAAGTVAGD